MRRDEVGCGRSGQGLNLNLDQNIVYGQAQPDGDQNLTG
jgi:hypothetical protein